MVEVAEMVVVAAVVLSVPLILAFDIAARMSNCSKYCYLCNGLCCVTTVSSLPKTAL